jgi:LCP family protein required for cell wall assembly
MSKKQDFLSRKEYIESDLHPVDDNIGIEVEIPKQKKKFSISKLISFLLIIGSLALFGVGGYYGYQIVLATNNTVVCEEGEKCGGTNLIGDLFDDLVTQPEDIKVKGEEEGRTNALIIGKDAAASLTDTIILVSFFHEEKKVVTLNFPRDIFVNASYTTDSGQSRFVAEKINAVFPFAERDSSKEGAGARALSDFISKEYGIPIHYWAVTDFRGVAKVVDELGGVDVEVDKAFTDCQYPSANYGYIRPCPSFTVGTETMDGSRALIYARSRKAAGDGGDFARSRRQSLVIEAVAEKAKEKGIAGNLNSINSYLNILSGSVKTNIKPSEVLSFYRKYGDLDVRGNFLRVVWDDGNGILCAGDASRGYNLVYCGGAIPGREVSSPARTKAKNQVKNLLAVAQAEELSENRVAILGNQSNDTNAVRQYLVSLGFSNIYYNNAYSTQIAVATPTSKEKISIYIPDEGLRKNFESIAKNSTLDFEVSDQIPSSITLPNTASGSDIVVWVESV